MSRATTEHPSAADLAAFALGKLDAGTADSVQAHLATCVACRTIAESAPADSLVELLRQAGPPRSHTAAMTPSVQGAATAGLGPAPPPEPPDVPPALRGHPKYAVSRLLGRGGMGVVYLAEHRDMDRSVALKVLNRLLVDKADALERFAREIKAAARLDHPNIVKAYDAERVGDLQLLVLEYVEGRNLADVVQKKGPLPIPNACHYARQTAQALQHAHEQGMVHRDIKPHNLMLTPRGVVKVLDFGLAKLRRAPTTEKHATSADVVMGTPEYMAPEQAQSTKDADIRADIYSLGCTLFHFLSGRPPFTGDNPLGIVIAQVQQQPPPVESLRPEVPPPLADLIRRMLAKAPADRPQTPKEVADALAPFAKSRWKPEQPTDATTPSDLHDGLLTLPTSRRRWPIPVAAAGMLLLFGIALWAAGALRVRTPHGTIVLTIPEPGAEVQVDGSKITVTRTGSQTVEITALPGQRLSVRKDGFEAWTKEITLSPGAREELTAVLRPLPAAGPVGTKVDEPAAGGFVPLFNGKDLSGWTVENGGPKTWTVDNGTLVARGDWWQNLSYLLTDRDYGDFVLRLEFNLADHAGSGIVLRAEPGELLPHPYGQRLREHPVIRLEDQPTRSEVTGTTHWLVDGTHVRPTFPAKLSAPGEWNRLLVEVKGRTLRAAVNGRLVSQATLAEAAVFPDGTVPGLGRPKGRIGLLKHHGTVRFRNVEIKDLSPAVLAPLGSEWAGFGVVKTDSGERTAGGTWTIIQRRGRWFKAHSRAGFGWKSYVEGTIDDNGRITLQARERLEPGARPREAAKGGGEVGTDRMTVTVEESDPPVTVRVDFKRLPDGGKSFVFAGTWKCFHRPDNWSGIRTINRDGTFVDFNQEAGAWARDGGLIVVNFPNGGREWLVIDPDKPNELNGSNGQQSVTWVRQ